MVWLFLSTAIARSMDLVKRRGRSAGRDDEGSTTTSSKLVGATIMIQGIAMRREGGMTVIPPLVWIRPRLLLPSRVKVFGMINKQKQSHR